MVRKAVIGLGGNLGDVERQLRLALEALDGLCGTKLLRVSPIYRTAAVEVTGSQPDYLNCVAEIETSLSPHALLGACLGIESALGRLREGVKSPDPPSEQKMQPPVPQVPSLLGQVMPPSRLGLYSFVPYCSMQY